MRTLLLRSLVCSRLLLAGLLLAVAAPRAQSWDPRPSEKLEALAPFVGSWRGEGRMIEPGGVETPWTSHSTYRWALNGHFLQEDFTITMQGLSTPMVIRSYVGWDREHSRYVSVTVRSEGVAALNEVHLLDSGEMLTVQTHHLQGVPYQERARVVVDGDVMKMRIDMLLHEGDSLQVIDGVMKRCDDALDGDWDTPTWMGAQPTAPMAKLARMAGSYVTKGEMAMAPGAPMTEIAGADRWDMVFGGTVMQCRTEGQAGGGGGATYECYAYWAWDAHRRRLRNVYVDNMGMVGAMDGWWHQDKLVSTMAGLSMGTPTTQRFVIHVDADGVTTGCEGHTAMGLMEPFLSFRMKFEKKK